MEQIGNIHVIQNQYSLERAGRKRQRVHKQRYAELRDSRYGSRLSREEQVIATSANPEETVEAIAKHYKPGDVLALLTGDGGFHDIINGIARFAPDPALKAARFLVLDGGFANDAALQLNPRHALWRPSRILDRGRTIDFRPQAWRFANAKGSSLELAALYGTVGKSATAGIAVSEESNRIKASDSTIAKFLIAREAAQRARPLTFTTPGSGEKHQAYDIGFANGSRMAGRRGAFPVRLEENRSYRYQLDSPGAVLDGLRLATGLIRGKYVDQPYTMCLPHGGDVQLDGEGWHLPQETLVTVSPSREVFTAFASRSARSEQM